MRIQLLVLTCAVLAFGVAGCGWAKRTWASITGGGDDGGSSSAAASSGGGYDAIQGMIDNMQNTAMVPYFVTFHKDPAVGQWATYESAAGTEWYGVVGGESGAWLVEKRYAPMAAGGDDTQIALLMQVDDSGNVEKAWAAKYRPDAEEKPAGKEVKVMEKPEPQDGEAEGDGPKPEWSKGEHAGLKCDVMTVDKSKMWMTPEGYFSWMLAVEEPSDKGGVVKMEYDGKVQRKLVEQGEKKEPEPSMKTG